MFDLVAQPFENKQFTWSPLPHFARCINHQRILSHYCLGQVVKSSRVPVAPYESLEMKLLYKDSECCCMSPHLALLKHS